MKKIYLLLLMLVSTLSFGQGLEDFTNATNLPNNYADGNFVGNNNITWTYTQSRAAQTNDGGNPTAAQLPALMLRRVSSDSKIVSSTISGGIGDFSVKLYKQFTGGGNRQVELFINGVSQGTSTPFDDYDEHIFTISGINIAGDIIIEIRNITAKQVAIDDITWTGFSGAASPILTIDSPSDGEVFAPNTTDVDVAFTIQNFTVANGTGDGYIVYTVDGGTATDKFDTTPITVTGLTAGTTHTVDMELVDNSGNALNPAVTASVTFEIATYTQVATLADLRAGTVGDYYHYTGEAFTTAGKPVGNNFVGYAQDATAGIAAFVPAGISTNQPTLGDGISDIKGQLSDYHGVLQIKLIEDFTMTGNNQVQVPQVVTIADYKANHDDYESELIRFDNVTIDPDGDTEFQSSKNYDVTDGAETVVLRTNFPDLVGETIPTTAVNMSGIAAEYNGTAQIFPRDINDIVDVNAIAENQIDGLSVYPNPVADKVIYVSSANGAEKQIIIYNILGKVVYNTNVNNNEAINIGQLKAGMYMMKIIENNKVALQKILVK